MVRLVGGLFKILPEINEKINQKASTIEKIYFWKLFFWQWLILIKRSKSHLNDLPSLCCVCSTWLVTLSFCNYFKKFQYVYFYFWICRKPFFSHRQEIFCWCSQIWTAVSLFKEAFFMPHPWELQGKGSDEFHLVKMLKINTISEINHVINKCKNKI